MFSGTLSVVGRRACPYHVEDGEFFIAGLVLWMFGFGDTTGGVRLAEFAVVMADSGAVKSWVLVATLSGGQVGSHLTSAESHLAVDGERCNGHLDSGTRRWAVVEAFTVGSSRGRCAFGSLVRRSEWCLGRSVAVRPVAPLVAGPLSLRMRLDRCRLDGQRA